ncbi:MAG: multicopper oxidase domain-containing protein [Egibacteraceae bacterium]
MADIHYWIQIENRPWDASPNNIDRMTGLTIQQTTGFAPVDVELTSPAAGSMPRPRRMYNPLRRGSTAADVADALILRRYRPPTEPDQSDAWTVPDDRKVNPWDINEPDPGENGTRGTIPGPTIECDVGDTVFVHFKNADYRIDYDPYGRTHSLHPHGFVFEATSDGAFPLSPPDRNQPIGDEAAAWAEIREIVKSPFKHGDRVPSGGTFTYRWDTAGWPTTAGVWLYHDHSVNDMENVEFGAIGIIVIHNKNEDNQDVDVRLPTSDDPTAPDPALMPGGSAAGSPIEDRPIALANPIPVRAADLTGLGRTGAPEPLDDPDDAPTPPLAAERAVELGPEAGGLIGELDPSLTEIRRLFVRRYRIPPQKLVILQLYHELRGVEVCINGRKYLGNTPTVLAGQDTQMRFGLVGMGTMFHTFHLHGHRWIIPGPHGTDPTTQQFSPMDTPVSQFEDTRTFGPANSFVFTIDGRSGSFMRAGGPMPEQALGEWHMHCHVLDHMMDGMMGSLLIVQGGETVTELPVGRPHSPAKPGNGGGPTPAAEVHLRGGPLRFDPPTVEVRPGETVTWIWDHALRHTVTSDTLLPSGQPLWDSGVRSGGPPFPRFPFTFTTPGTFQYHCELHTDMTGTVEVRDSGSPMDMDM